LSVTIHFPTPLRKFTAGAECVESAAHNLREVFEDLDVRFPGFGKALTKADGAPQQFLNIYVNEEDIRFLGGLQYTFRDGDEVLFIPAIAGGC
jgi:sulfur-carrier protein